MGNVKTKSDSVLFQNKALPIEVVQHILKYLVAKELLSCLRVCKTCYFIASQKSLWKALYEKSHPLYSIPEDTSTNWKLLYFRQRNPRKFAVLLAGSGYWGKSSLLHRLRYGNWAELSIADSSPPLPHEVFRKYEIDVDNVNVSIDYWEVGDSPGVWGDFSDEEPINLELHRFDGFVLGYRITDKANFTALQGYIDRIKRFKKVGRFRPIIIVANMLDEERSRVTATSEGMAFGIANNYPFFEISVKSGSNITEPLVTLVRLMLIQQPARTTQQPAPQATLPSPKKK